jgi:hypothetical protein
VNNVPLLKAYVRGDRQQLTDKALARSFVGLPFLTAKVIGAIHWQALKLWVKGLRLQKRPAPPRSLVSIQKGAHHSS